MTDYRKLLDGLTPYMHRAGDAIMAVHAKGVVAQIKSDGSPVTEADEAAEAILLEGLAACAPDIFVVSEENTENHKVDAPEQFFLVDPLDGTREFLKNDGKGSFTVNVGLIENGEPVMGLLLAPALGLYFAGIVGQGAWLNGAPISVRDMPEVGPTVLASVSHRDEATDQWLADNPAHELVGIGSSLKFGWVACGKADIYPRFAQIMEWDTAAGDAVVRAAGGRVENPDGSPFVYGKANYRNGAFIAYGG